MPARMAAPLVLLLAAFPALAQHSPYAGQETREVKALSPEEIAELLDGRGMGMAKAAELNAYPGPAHVLDLGAQLGLDDRQRDALQAVKQAMTAAARSLGADILGRERELDRMFAEGRADRETVARTAEDIGRLQGRLRGVHLAAHIETRALLSAAQIRRYDELRGYRAGGGAAGHHGPGHGHARHGANP